MQRFKVNCEPLHRRSSLLTLMVVLEYNCLQFVYSCVLILITEKNYPPIPTE